MDTDSIRLRKELNKLQEMVEANETNGETNEIRIASGQFPANVHPNMIVLRTDIVNNNPGGQLYRWDVSQGQWLTIA